MLPVNADRLGQQRSLLLSAVYAISDIYLGEGRFDDALALLRSDLLTHLSEFKPEDRVRVQYQCAKVMRHKCWLNSSGYDGVLEMLSEAREAAESLDNRKLLADIVDLIGETMYLKELWHSSLEVPADHFRQGLALREEIDDRRGVAASLIHIGWVYQHKTDADQEDAERAFECFQRAYRLAEEGHYRLERAEAARHMADMYRRQGELDRALACHLEFVATSEEVGYKIYLPPGYTMVGISYLTKGESDKALEYCEKAYSLAEALGSRWFLAESAFGIGAAHEAKGDKDTALRYYREALAAGQAVDFRLVVNLASKKIEALSNSGGL
jgi:tetratricopeptide (TPR) repeat protein